MQPVAQLLQQCVAAAFDQLVDTIFEELANHKDLEEHYGPPKSMSKIKEKKSRKNYMIFPALVLSQGVRFVTGKTHRTPN